MSPCCWLCVQLLLGLATGSAHANIKPAYQYCIIGAGPGGLQLGHYLHSAGRDYAIFERAPTAGAFFDEYPRHRKLISLNKRFTGRVDPEFNLRHDWNSLLDQPAVRPMTNRSIERWPPADVLVEYLREYGKEQEETGRLHLNTAVERITKQAPGVFQLQLDVGLEVQCSVVVMAVGLWEPNVPTDTIPGIEHAIGYEDLPTTGDSFEQQSVLVLGAGNSALETADALAPYVNYVHVLNPSGNVLRPSWETRYPGSPRAINAAILDAYLLKSLDGGLKPIKLSIHKCTYKSRAGAPSLEDEGRAARGTEAGAEKLCVFPLMADIVSGEQVGAGLVTMVVPETVIKSEWGVKALQMLGGVIQVGEPVLTASLELHKVNRGRITPLTLPRVREQVIQIHPDDVTAANVDTLMQLSAFGGSPYPMVYDKVVRCLGWKHNLTMYSEGSQPVMQANNKYAVMNAEYESVNVPGLYYAGTLSHGKDVRRSAGAFIHGFRYTARALFRVLEQKHQQQAWPSKEFDCSNEGLDNLVKHTMRRINTASGPYQMINSLADVILLHPNGTLQYLEELPVAYAHQQYHSVPRVVWNFGYWNQRQSLQQSVSEGTYFEIFVWFFTGTSKIPTRFTSKQVLRMTEAFHTDWDTPAANTNLWHLIASKAPDQCAGSVSEDGIQWADELQRDSRPAGMRSLAHPKVPREPGADSNYDSHSWPLGEVDLLARNVGAQPVELFQNKISVAKLSAGGGQTLLAHDGDLWEAKGLDGRLEKKQWVDVAFGKAQDMLIGDVPQCHA